MILDCYYGGMDVVMEAPPPPAQALTLAREAKGWTQRELAEAAGVSQAVVSKAESGLADLGGRLPQVADALGCPPDVLEVGLPLLGAPVTCLHHRRRTSQLTAKAQKRVQALAQLTRVSVAGVVAAADEAPQVDELLQVGGGLRGPAHAAAAVRDRFGLGESPVEDAIALVEQTGTVVVVRVLGAGGQDAVSSWAGVGDVPLVVMNTALPVDRQRFTVLHELAHLLLHVVPDEGQEQEAHQFAAELLLPVDVAARELAGLGPSEFRRLLELKEKWGLSIGALLQRALDSGCIGQGQFKDMRIRLARLGWHRIEPGNLRPERPERLLGLVARARRRGLGDVELAAAAQMTLPKFLSESWLSASEPEFDEEARRG